MAAHDAEVPCDLQPLDPSRPSATSAPSASGPLQTLKALRLAMAMTQQTAKAAEDKMVNEGTGVFPPSGFLSNVHGSEQGGEGGKGAMQHAAQFGRMGITIAPPHGPCGLPVALAAMHLHPVHAPPMVGARAQGPSSVQNAETWATSTGRTGPPTSRPAVRGVGGAGGSRSTSGGGSSSAMTAASAHRLNYESSSAGASASHFR